MTETSAPAETRCTRQGCPDTADRACAYVDRDGVRCATRWCSDHVEIVRDLPYCRRHTTIMRALAGAGLDAHRPPVRNRAASLVAWVANDMSQRIEWALQNVVDRAAGEEISGGGIEYRLDDHTGHHIWLCRWRVAAGGDADPRLSLSIEADEARDYEIGILVNADVMTVTIPSWVKHHMEFEEVAADVDRIERTAFYADLTKRIGEALAAPR